MTQRTPAEILEWLDRALEPGAAIIAYHGTDATLATAAAVSQAISLKRIADMFDKATVTSGDGYRIMRTRHCHPEDTR